MKKTRPAPETCLRLIVLILLNRSTCLAVLCSQDRCTPKCGLFGVSCPALPQQINFIIDEGMSCGKGSNSVISNLHFFLKRYGVGETEAVLHCDNCSGQNKNKYMLWYCYGEFSTNPTEEYLSFQVERVKDFHIKC